MHEKQGFRARGQLTVPILAGVESGLSTGLDGARPCSARRFIPAPKG